MSLSPFGDSSEFQEEEIHDSHYEQHSSSTLAPSSASGSVVDTSVTSQSILSHYSQAVEPSALASSPSASDADSTSGSASAEYDKLTQNIGSLRVTNGTLNTTTTHLPPDLTEQFEVAKNDLLRLWESISLPDPSAFTHAVYTTDRFFGSFQVSVTDPERRGDNLNSFVVYKVVSSVEYSPDSPTTGTVIRRYSDFAWLHEQLSYSPLYGGFLIPALPDKAVIGRFGEDFVEDRRRGLELFLRKTMTHPQLRFSEDLRVFLTAQDAAFAVARARKRGPTITQPDATPASNSVVSFFKERVQGIASTFVAQREFERSPDDVACEKAFNYSKHLQESLIKLNEHTETLLKRERNVARSWVEVGIAASVLSQFEAESGEKLGSQALNAIGTRCDQIAVTTAQKVELERQGLRDILKDHVRHAEAVQEMLKIRNIVNQNYHQAQLNLEARQNKQNVKDQAQQARLIAEAQQILNQRQHDLTEVTGRARVEFARFNKERQRALKEAIRHFVKLQVDHSKQIQEVWESVLPELENL